MAKFFEISRIRMQDGNAAGRIDIYGEIEALQCWGDEITPATLAGEINALGPVSELEVHIFSGGGDVFAALAIYNILKQQGKPITVYIDGLAASAATVISCVGDTVYMPETAMVRLQ